MSDRKTFKVYVKCSTWARDSHMLYDYENKEIVRQRLVLESDSCIYRSEKNVYLAKDTSPDSLVQISLEFPYFKLTSQQPMWRIVRSPKSSQRPARLALRQGSVIKLGRLSFQVKMLKTHDDFLETVETGRVNDPTVTCRICFIEDCPNDPLISICKCLGSIQYIHVNCLQSWILSKLSPGEEDPALKFLKSIYCELCKNKLPYQLKIEGVEYDMLKRFKPKVPFLILEGIQSEQREPGVYLISFFSKQSVMLGRGHDSDVRIPDISVSRCHAKIGFEQDSFYLEDNWSKFGTLVQVENPLISEELQILQCGRTVVEVSTTSQLSDKFHWEEE